MSILTQRSALVMQLAQIDATPCAACSHPLSVHRLAPRRPGQSARNNPSCQQRKLGDFVCKCKGFCETTDEQIALKV